MPTTVHSSENLQIAAFYLVVGPIRSASDSRGSTHGSTLSTRPLVATVGGLRRTYLCGSLGGGSFPHGPSHGGRPFPTAHAPHIFGQRPAAKGAPRTMLEVEAIRVWGPKMLLLLLIIIVVVLAIAAVIVMGVRGWRDSRRAH